MAISGLARIQTKHAFAFFAGHRPQASLTRLIALIILGSVIFLSLGAFIFLVWKSGTVLWQEGLSFFLEANWHFRGNSYGAKALFLGSIITAFLALMICAPFSLFGAWALQNLRSEKIRFSIEALVTLMASVPSVVCGLLGILLLRPFLLQIFSPFGMETGDGLLTASLLLSIMILPTLFSLQLESFSKISKKYREQAFCLGLSRTKFFWSVVFPFGLPAILSSFALGLGRAAGETVAVFLVIGRLDNKLPSEGGWIDYLLNAGQSMTTKLGGPEIFISHQSPTHESALLLLALCLILMSVGTSTILLKFSKGKP
ncbi:MAG: hypothetical protein COV44_05680 [Deltaproteobacteria bacterium CG11_big_fil_rev_8_21_14_0_20_45_16]|nr:MAG: hypothetical protein COV44_05680 [Deltaproteobacteria bacterium CG11_big_fil_rev_8_21_14_0_20_45_16]